MPCIVRTLSLLVSLTATRFAAAQTAPNPLNISPHHVTASVAHLELEAAWYERVLGFKRSVLLGGRKDFGLYQMTMPGNRIDLVWQSGSARPTSMRGPAVQGWLHVVFTTPNLNEAYKFLVGQHTDVIVDRDAAGHAVHLTLHDPEGNEIGLVEPDPAP